MINAKKVIEFLKAFGVAIIAVIVLHVINQLIINISDFFIGWFSASVFFLMLYNNRS